MTPEVIERFKDFLVNPLKWKCSYKPLHECFVEGDHYEPQDKLFEAYLNYIKNRYQKSFSILSCKRNLLNLVVATPL